MKLKAFKQIGLMLVAGVAGLGVGAAVMYQVHPTSAASDDTSSPVLHYVAEQAATCEKAGTKAYWEKDGKYYVDQAGTTEINADELAIWRVIAPTHDLYYHKKDTSCGAKFAHDTYFECIHCGKYFRNEAGKNEIKDLNDIALEQAEHITVWQPAQEPTACGEEGLYGHYECRNCHQTFSDEAGLHPYNPVHKLQHDVHKVSAQKATCEEAGNIEYYHCAHCGKNFQESTCDHELENVLTNPLGHDCMLIEEVPATCEKSGTRQHYHCVRCEQDFADAAGIQKLNSIITEQLKHEYEVVLSHDNRLNEPCQYIDADGRVFRERVQYQVVCEHCGEIGDSQWYTAYAKLDQSGSRCVEDKCVNYETHMADGKQMIDVVVYKIKASDLDAGKVKIMLQLPGIYTANAQCRNATSGAGYSMESKLQSGLGESKLIELDANFATYWEFDWEGDGAYEQIIRIVIE